MAMPTATSPRTNPDHAELHNFHVNVKMFGAVGDGVTNDTAAFQSAIDATTNTDGKDIFVPFGNYKIGALTFPTGSGATDNWHVLHIAGTLTLTAPLVVPKRWAIVGVTGGNHIAFDKGPGALITSSGSVDPFISITDTGGDIRLENLNVKTVQGDGIYINGGVTNVMMKNVHVESGASATGSPLRINRGFGFYLQDCGFSGPTATSHPSISLECDVNDQISGLFMRDCFLNNRGIKVSASVPVTAACSHFEFDSVLYESGKDDAFITFDNTNANFISVSLHHVWIVDPLVSPMYFTKAIAVASTNRVTGVWIDQSDGASTVANETAVNSFQGLFHRHTEAVSTPPIGVSSYTQLDRFGQIVQPSGHRVSTGRLTLSGPDLTMSGAGAYMEFLENGAADAAAGAANTGRVYARDNGAGKSQLVVRFNSGAVQVLATEP